MSLENHFPYPNSPNDISFKYQSDNPIVPQHGVNVVLGGAMISGIIVMLFVICYCCHRNQLKREIQLHSYWREPSAMLSSEIFTIDGSQLIEVAEFQDDSSNSPSPGPPPPYDSIVDRAPSYESVVDLENETENERDIQYQRKTRRWSNSQAVIVPIDDSEPPSYECALKLQNAGHI